MAVVVQGVVGGSVGLPSLLKWAGGKEHELKHILPLLPPFERYYEPFVGGGAVYFCIRAQQKFINDRSLELYHLYSLVAAQEPDFFKALDDLLAGWQAIGELVDQHAKHLVAIYARYSQERCSQADLEAALLEFLQQHARTFALVAASCSEYAAENFTHELRRNLLSKTRRMKTLERKKWRLPESDIVANIECALKSAFYMHLRHLYNQCKRYSIPLARAMALFFFVRENAYASMFRYNQRGEFNVPYGGISYNRKGLARKIAAMRSSELQRHLSETVIANMDFEDFLYAYTPDANDFVFVDPPYDSEFSTYARNEFTMRDHERLARYLRHDCRARFMLVIKNTPAILALYGQDSRLRIQTFGKKYLVSFQDRNDRRAEHLIITNF